jgi:hypothetical protein
MEQYVQTAPSNTESNLFELEVDHELSNTFSNMAKWAQFVGIAGFILTTIMLLVIFIIGKAFSAVPQFDMIMAYGGGAITTMYVIIAALFFFPALFAFNFSRKLKNALLNNDQQGLNAAFASLKLRFKFVGIVYIVIFSLWALIILLGLIF